MKSQKRKVSCFKSCMSFFNCKFLIITNQNLALDPDSQKSLGIDEEHCCRDAICFIVNHVYVGNQGTRETHLSARQTSFRASCLLTRLPVSLPGCLSACPATCQPARLLVSLPGYLSTCPATCQPARLPVSLPGFLSSCPAAFQPARLPVSLPGYLSACPATCQPARLSVSLPSCLSACLATCLSSCAYPETH
jgi:hypothetical protein